MVPVGELVKLEKNGVSGGKKLAPEKMATGICIRLEQSY